MDDGAAGKCSWVLEQSIGVFRGDVLTGRVDVSRPELGLRDLQLEGSNLAGTWFSVSREAELPSRHAVVAHDERPWPLTVADVYVRGADLVASYQPSSDWPYSPQIYWRVGPLDSIAGVVGSQALLISVQTHLLDTFPRIGVDSTTDARDVFQLTANGGKCGKAVSVGREFGIQASTGICCILRRFTGESPSYAEFMSASDFRAVQAGQGDDGNCRVQWQLFAEFLEKGVIRRARVHGAFLRRESDVEAAAACCAAIERESLPLTT